MAEHGMFVWNELVASDPDQSRAFFQELMGWASREVDMGPLGAYTVFEHDGKDVAGMMRAGAGQRPRWQAYVAVDDVDAVAARAEELGGRVLDPPSDIPGVGRIATVADPTGAAVSLLTPARRR